MNYSNKACAFTGYRTRKLNSCFAVSGLTMKDLERHISERLVAMLDDGFTDFLCGMALGSDLLFARAVVELREQYPLLPIRLIAAVPCIGHDRGWGQSDRDALRELAAQADKTVLVSNSAYYDGCMAKRNRYLVNNCDELLAVYDGQYGGTMQTVNYAKQMQKRITIIDPSRAVLITLRESGRRETKLKR